MPKLPEALQNAFAPMLAVDAELGREALVRHFKIENAEMMNMSQVACHLISRDGDSDEKDTLLRGITEMCSASLQLFTETMNDIEDAGDDTVLVKAALANAKTGLREINLRAKEHLVYLQGGPAPSVCNENDCEACP